MFASHSLLSLVITVTIIFILCCCSHRCFTNCQDIDPNSSVFEATSLIKNLQQSKIDSAEISDHNFFHSPTNSTYSQNESTLQLINNHNNNDIKHLFHRRITPQKSLTCSVQLPIFLPPMRQCSFDKKVSFSNKEHILKMVPKLNYTENVTCDKPLFYETTKIAQELEKSIIFITK